MEKYLKKLKPSMLKYMRAHYDEDEVRKRWKKVEELDAEWIRKEGNLGGSRNMMSSNMMLCYAMCAFYEAVDRRFTEEDFLVLLHEVMAKPFALLNRIDMNKLENKKWLMDFLYFCVGKYKRKADRKRGKQWGNTWKLRINPDCRQKGIAYVLDSCPLYEFARKYGYLDFLSNMCASDRLVARQFHAHLIRHHTLSAGDGKCEYWYVGDKSLEALNDKDSK